MAQPATKNGLYCAACDDVLEVSTKSLIEARQIAVQHREAHHA